MKFGVANVMRGALYVVALGACFGFGYGWKDMQSGSRPGGINLLQGIRATSPSMSAEGAFQENFDRILTNHRSKVDPKKLKYAAMEGMVAALGDPHTNYFEPRTAEAFNSEIEGNFFGIGAKLGEDPLGAKVATVFQDAPAFKAGLKEGDVITAVDDVVMSGKTTDYIVSKIKGKEGTTVKLTVMRIGQEKPITMVVRRAQITTPTVEGKMLPDNVGFVQVYSFSVPTPMQFEQAITKLESQGMKGLIIDMRGNPGGRLEAASKMLSRWFDSKVVIKMEMRAEPTFTSPTVKKPVIEYEKTRRGEVQDTKYPIVVLVNEDSASAAEIFAGVMRDYKRATIMGEKTYGKASVQTVIDLTDGAGVKLTIAKYYLPNGEYINRKVDEDGAYISGGLMPDIEVKPDETKQYRPGELDSDLQAKKAHELVKSRS